MEMTLICPDYEKCGIIPAGVFIGPLEKVLGNFFGRVAGQLPHEKFLLDMLVPQPVDDCRRNRSGTSRSFLDIALVDLRDE